LERQVIVYLNGQYVDDSRAAVALFDGGYLFGDGVFETIRLYGGLPFDLAEIRSIIKDLVNRNGITDMDGRCRLTVSRGSLAGNPFVLSGHQDLAPTVSLFVQPLGPETERMQTEGIGLKVMQSEFARGNFPHIKSLNYLTTIMALRAAHRDGCAEALLVGADGHVLECATSNIFMTANS
jgi:branched-subunit amino acid aminotransferase/4-amino-4-deoxychorismate lyase